VTTWVEGADYSYAHPDPHGYRAAGKLFALRYFSRTAGKGLSVAERDSLWAADVVIGGLSESTANRALAGHAAGVADGLSARAIARGLDYPDSLPIFYAVDFNATDAQLAGAVGDYLYGVASADPHAGVYGGLHTVGYVLDRTIMAWAFQTGAWSAGVWDARAQIQQYHNGVTVAGGDVDLCRAHDTFPFWTDPGLGDQGGSGMALTDADVDTILGRDKITNPSARPDSPLHSPAGANQYTGWGFAVGDTWDKVYDTLAATASIQADVDALSAAVATLTAKVDAIPTTALPPAPMPDADVARIAAAVLDMQAARLAE
jgi:hypothetical protein